LNNISDSFSNWENQNITLAAVVQCAALVYELAFTGKADQRNLISSINPIFVLNPGSFNDVYPNVEQLTLGLNTVQKIFANNRTRKNAEIIRYTLGMLTLRQRLKSSSRMQSIVRESLEPMTPLHPLENDRENMSSEDLELLKQDRTFRQLSNIYRETISTISFRIQVAGKVEYLKNENIANRIRGLLFAGIRSAVLWHQLKGRRWQLLFYRKRIQETAGAIRQKLLIAV
jgi:high frequency lysogenization protein